MGKGYNNYMCKKPFHPGSKANIKRAWMAEQQTENDKRKQEELKAQYEKEQDLYNNRALISSESKDKLQLNFMYEAPPGAKRERQKEDDEPEFKFEWQRKYNAPREDYAKGNEDIKDQPFGIPVRNVRCIKCHKWGHINTDKECPLYHQASTSSMPTTSMDPMELMRQMREDGFGLKENVLGHQLNPAAANQQFIPSDEESDPEIDFLKSLSSAEKKKLLKKLKKLSKKQRKSSNCKKKKKGKKTKKSKSRASFSSDSEKEKKAKKKKSKKSSSSDSDSSSDESEIIQTKKIKLLNAKEKRSKSEKKNSIEHANFKESPIDARRSEYQSQGKYKKMSEEYLNVDRYNSKEDIAHKKVTKEQRQESSNPGKHKSKGTKHLSEEKYSRETCKEDLIQAEYASKKDIAHKKVKSESVKESFDHNKHKTKEAKHEKNEGLRTESKVKHSSSNSEEERHQPVKNETFHNDVALPAPKRKHETSLCKEDSNLVEHASKEDTAHKKVRSEQRKDTSEHGRDKSKESKHVVGDLQTGKKVKHLGSNSEQEKNQAVKIETLQDDVGLPTLKRKQETSGSKGSPNSSTTKKDKYNHPDGFSHLCPQAEIKANYLQLSEEYEGKIHDEFRHHYRKKRSPSVKQKYNK